jgi:hypothetical protein
MHVVTVVPRYAAGPEGRGAWAPTPTVLPALNDDEIRALGRPPMGELTGRLLRDLADLHAQIRAYGPAVPTFRFHGGSSIAADQALGILLGELVVHGNDIATALRRPWPIDPAHVELILQGVNPILPGWVDPAGAAGLSATFELRLRGQGTHVWSFADGRLVTARVGAPGAGVPDVHISGDPAYLLLLLYRRVPQWRGIATGKLLAWGRRPWLAFTLTSRFHKP